MLGTSYCGSCSMQPSRRRFQPQATFSSNSETGVSAPYSGGLLVSPLQKARSLVSSWLPLQAGAGRGRQGARADGHAAAGGSPQLRPSCPPRDVHPFSAARPREHAWGAYGLQRPPGAALPLGGRLVVGALRDALELGGSHSLARSNVTTCEVEPCSQE